MRRLQVLYLALCLCTSAWFYLWIFNGGVGTDGQRHRKSFPQPEQRCQPLKRKVTVQMINGLDQHFKDALQCRFTMRRNALEHTCKASDLFIDRSMSATRHDGRKTYVEHGLTFCRVEKIASMFWDHYFRIYDIVHYDNVSVPTFKLKDSDYVDTLKIVFVRDPYARLLSGYIDKLFSVHPEYWGIMGKDILQEVRHKGENVSECGVDVTFPEFVDYILKEFKTNPYLNHHFKPLHLLCSFCDMKYDLIGKIETFLEDVLYVSDVIGTLEHSQFKRAILKAGFKGARKMIYRNAFNLFSSRLKMAERCGVNKRQALKITWRRWKIRGLIETKFDFPFPPDANETFDEFYATALKAHDDSDPQKLRESKKDAMRQAYAMLTLETRARLKAVFEPQFEMFGYQSTPDDVFGHWDKSKNNFDFYETETLFLGTEI